MRKLSVIYFKIIKRFLLHIVDVFIPSKVSKKNFVSWATFPKFKMIPDKTKYHNIINIAFCFNEGYIHLFLTAASSLLENSPGCKYDIYCVTDINKSAKNKILKYIKNRYSNGNIIFLKPNTDYDNAYCGRWSKAIWWRCMLPKLLPDNVKRIIYADVDTLFVRDLREANEFKIEDYLLAGCFDRENYINSGFLVMNIEQFRLENKYQKMVHWAITNQTNYPDQDMLNTICCGRIKPMSRKFNLIIDAGYSFLKTMDISMYRDIKHPVMLHYAGKVKPWKTEIKRFLTFKTYRKYYNSVTNNY